MGVVSPELLRGRPGRLSGTRELIPHGTYRLVYDVRGDTVWILALIHMLRLSLPETE